MEEHGAQEKGAGGEAGSSTANMTWCFLNQGSSLHIHLRFLASHGAVESHFPAT